MFFITQFSPQNY